MSIVEVQGLRKVYPAFVLNDLSFGIEAGRITGFIGRNGAGKTTTIKAMLNLVHPDSGSVRCFGREFRENEAEIKKHIGYSTGTVNWYPRKKIRDIVSIEKGFYDTWDDEAYRMYRDLFRLDESKTPLALSHRAEVLILDEPTSGLDPFSRGELLDIFKRLRDEGVAVFFSTHIISDLEKCADDIVYLSAGNLIAASSLPAFVRRFSRGGESLEDTMLRLEGGEGRA